MIDEDELEDDEVEVVPGGTGVETDIVDDVDGEVAV